MKCYEEFSIPTNERGDEVSIATFLCKRRMMEFHVYIEDNAELSPENEIQSCSEVMKRALSVCCQCPLFQQGSGNECNDR